MRSIYLVCLVACTGSNGDVLNGVDAPASDAAPLKAWETIASGTTTDLFGVWGVGATSVFAVGGTPGVTSGNPGVIVHWDGNATVTPYLVNLLGVFSRTAVGEYGGEGSMTTRNGTSWSARDVLAAGSLRGTWETSPGSYIVGDNGRLLYTSETGVAGSWMTLTSNTPDALHGVWGSSSSDVYAVGAGGVILHNTNAGTGGTGTWTKKIVGSSTLRAVWGSSANDVYVVGEAPAVILHSTDGGANWTTATLPGSAIGLYGVGGRAANDVYVVGATGGLVFHSTGNDQWTTQSLPSTKDMFGVWVDATSGDAFAVGRGGTLVRKPL